VCPVVGGQKTLVSRLDRGNVFVSQLKVIEYTTSSGGTSSTGVAGSSAKSSYHTVLQFPYDPAKAVYELDGTYGAILAMKQVNSKFYYNVLDTTNADFGTLNFECSHPEMA